jgi:hypothetical protein
MTYQYTTVAHRCRCGHPDDLLVGEDNYTSELIRSAIYSPHDGIEIDISCQGEELFAHHANTLPVDPLPIEDALAELAMMSDRKMLFIDCDPKEVEHIAPVVRFLSNKNLCTIQGYISTFYPNVRLIKNVVVHSHLQGPCMYLPSRMRLLRELQDGPKVIYTNLSRDIIDMWISEQGGSIEAY